MRLLIFLSLVFGLIALSGYILFEVYAQIYSGGAFTLVELLLGGILISLLLLVTVMLFTAK